MGTCSNTDGGNGEHLGDLAGELAWYTFNQDDECACFFRTGSVLKQSVSVSLNFVPTQSMNALRSEAYVSNGRDASIDQGLDCVGLLMTSLKFHSMAFRLFHDLGSSGERMSDSQLTYGKGRSTMTMARLVALETISP